MQRDHGREALLGMQLQFLVLVAALLCKEQLIVESGFNRIEIRVFNLLLRQQVLILNASVAEDNVVCQTVGNVETV